MKRLDDREIEDLINEQEGNSRTYHPLNHKDYEKYCGSCMNFETRQCPRNGKVTETTTWHEAKCNKGID